MRARTIPLALFLGLLGCSSDDTSAQDDTGSSTGPGGTGSAGSTSGPGTSSTAADGSTSTTAAADSSSTGEPVPVDYEPVLLDCTPGSSFPFETEGSGFDNPDAEAAAAANARIKDAASDLLGNLGGPYAYTTLTTDDSVGDAVVYEGIKARTMNDAGLDGEALAGEAVSLWRYDGETWTQLDRRSTEADGTYGFEGAPTSNNNDQPLYAVLEADQSCTPHYTWLLDPGTPVVVTDIDGTLTLSDEELLTQISDGMHDPALMGSSAELMQAWAAKGYDIVYITARPHVFRAETRAWLVEHDFPTGPLITANSLVLGPSAQGYKASWGARMLDDFGWTPVAAYGNADTDIGAYDDAGIPKDITFIVGELAGTEGTMPIENEDYAAHIAAFVDPYPDAP